MFHYWCWEIEPVFEPIVLVFVRARLDYTHGRIAFRIEQLEVSDNRRTHGLRGIRNSSMEAKYYGSW